jgi:diguanylate cyclase (GGDEF)-like protein/PAS domain S-box-containing protein
MLQAGSTDGSSMAVALQPLAIERQMLDAIGESVMATDADGAITYANQAAASAFRASDTDDLLGRTVHELLTPTASRRELQEIAETIVAGETWTGVLTGCRLDGTTFPHRVTLAPQFDEHGEIVGTVGVGRDITPEVSASAKLRASDERFRRVFDESPVAMGIVTTDMRIQRSNAAMERLLGYSSTELAGQTLAAVTHPADVHEDVEGTRRLLEDDLVTHQIQKRFVCKDGSIIVGRVTGTLIRDDQGEVLYGIGSVEDLTATIEAFTAIQEEKERLGQTLAAAGVATWDLDLGTLRQVVSDNYADVLGIPFDEVPDTFDEVIAIVHPDDRHLFLEPNPDDGAVDRFDVEFRMVPGEGALAWIGCKGSFVRDEQGELRGMRGTMVNLTAQRDVEIRRVAAEERYRQTIEAANDAFVAVDDRACICEWNAAATRMFGWSAEEIMGRPIIDTLIPEDRRERYALGQAEWAALLAAGQALPDRWEMSARHRDGHVFPIEMSLVSGTGGPNGDVRAFVRDITDRRAHERRLAELAVTDALTGLPDRSVLLDRLNEGLARLTDRHGAVGVLFVDVDRFKAVNDELGHEAGDQLLVSVAQRLRSAVRPADTVARLGGDEFAVVCTDLGGLADARLVAERILSALSAPIPLGAMEHEVCVSIGVAVTLDPSDEAEAIVRHADRAMYRAKNAGGRQASD